MGPKTSDLFPTYSLVIDGLLTDFGTRLTNPTIVRSDDGPSFLASVTLSDAAIDCFQRASVFTTDAENGNSRGAFGGAHRRNFCHAFAPVGPTHRRAWD